MHEINKRSVERKKNVHIKEKQKQTTKNLPFFKPGADVSRFLVVSSHMHTHAFSRKCLLQEKKISFRKANITNTSSCPIKIGGKYRFVYLVILINRPFEMS